MINNGNWRTSSQGLTKTHHVGHYEVSHNTNIVLLDSSADTCLCVQDSVVLEEIDCKVDVISYNDDTCTKDIAIGSTMTLATASDGTE